MPAIGQHSSSSWSSSRSWGRSRSGTLPEAEKPHDGFRAIRDNGASRRDDRRRHGTHVGLSRRKFKCRENVHCATSTMRATMCATRRQRAGVRPAWFVPSGRITSRALASFPKGLAVMVADSCRSVDLRKPFGLPASLEPLQPIASPEENPRARGEQARGEAARKGLIGKSAACGFEDRSKASRRQSTEMGRRMPRAAVALPARRQGARRLGVHEGRADHRGVTGFLVDTLGQTVSPHVFR